MNRVTNLQLLRAFAAISVVFYHTELLIHGVTIPGSFGVGIFFVISGFVMARVAQYESASTFVKRRLIRIVPLYWATTLLAFFTEPFKDGYQPTWTEFFKSILFIPFVKRNSALMQPVLVVGWTLNYEMLFYLLVGVCIALAAKRGALFAAISLPFLIALISRIHTPLGHFYSSLVMLEFAAGVGVFYLSQILSRELCLRLRNLLVIAAVVSVPLLWFAELSIGKYAVPTTLLVGPPATCLVLSFILLAKGGLDVKSQFADTLGNATYALYLTHPFVIMIFAHFSYLKSSPFKACLAVLSSILLSLILYTKVEAPFLRWASGASRNRKPQDDVKAIAIPA